MFWDADDFALGYYSFNPLGSTSKHRQDLSRPVGTRLFFAGEVTSTQYSATAHGAYLSGLRAAEEIIAAI